MNKLTPKHWRVYDLLKENAYRFMEQKEIALALPDLFPTASNEIDFHSNTGRELGQIIQDLNEDGTIQKIILSNAKGHKLANEEEYRVWSNRKWVSLKAQIKRLAYKDYKAGLNGQGKLIFDEESKAREWFETFIKEIK